MDNKIFRKTALDRISSPEQLNEYMKVAGAGVWWMLGGLAAVFVAFFVWGFMGSIPETVNLTGTAIGPGDGPMAVYCYLPIDETKQLREGMDVRISPDYAPKEQYGYIYGKIAGIGGAPVNAETLRDKLGEDIEYLTIPAGNVIEVVVELETSNGRPVWSSPKGASVDVTVGSTCSLTVITLERKPYELMFR